MKEISSHGSNDLDGYLRRCIQLHAAEDIGFRSCFVPAQWARRKVLTNSSNIEQNIAKCGQGTGNMSKSLSPINGFNLLDLQYLPILRQIYTNSKIGSFLFLNDIYQEHLKNSICKETLFRLYVYTNPSFYLWILMKTLQNLISAYKTRFIYKYANTTGI